MKPATNLFLLVMCLASCASGPSVDELASSASSVAYVRHGYVPLRFSAGVVDPASFWATYGEAVSTQLGGSEAIDEITEDARQKTLLLERRNEAIVESLFGGHSIVENIGDELLPEMANRWRLDFDLSDVIAVPAHRIFIDVSDDTLKGEVPDADLIFVVEVHELRLTEEFSTRSALLNGVTLGTNEKLLTVETPVNLLVFARGVTGAEATLVWGRRCGADYTSMDVAFSLDELRARPARMIELLNAAENQSIERCLRILRN